jgi:phosphatidylglycerophosphate synthase
LRTDFVVLLSILGLALASMPVFAITGRHRSDDPLESSKRGKFVLGSFARSWFYWFVHPVVALSLALRLSPTFFNLVGVAFGVAGGVAFANGNMALGGWGVLLGGIADALDGRIARAQGVAGPRGAFLDATLDRFAEFGAFIGLAVWFGDDPLALTVVTVALGASLIVSYARARGEVEGVLCSSPTSGANNRAVVASISGRLDSPSTTRA